MQWRNRKVGRGRAVGAKIFYNWVICKANVLFAVFKKAVDF